MAEQATRKRRIYEGMGERLRERRGELGFSQRSLSETSGVAVDVIVKLERDARGPRPSTLQKLAKTLGVSAEYLTTGREGEREGSGERGPEAAPVLYMASGGHAGARMKPPQGREGGPSARPQVRVLVLGEPDEETARTLERWIREDEAARLAGERDPWPAIARDLDEDRTSYRKLFE